MQTHKSAQSGWKMGFVASFFGLLTPSQAPANALSILRGPVPIAVMPQATQRKAVWCRPVFAGLMVALLLLLGLVASNERIHSQLHTDSPATHGSCSVCALAKGQLDAPAIFLSFVVASPSLAWTVPLLRSAPPPAADFSVASSRGPPASISSL